MYERDLIIGNMSDFEYWSPKALDNELDEIKMEVKEDEKYSYLNVTTLPNNTFMMSVNRTAISQTDDGLRSFEVLLSDQNQTTSLTKNRVIFEVEYLEINPQIVFR